MKVWFITNRLMLSGEVVQRGTDVSFGERVDYSMVRVANKIGHTDMKVYDTLLNDDRRGGVR